MTNQPAIFLSQKNQKERRENIKIDNAAVLQPSFTAVRMTASGVCSLSHLGLGMSSMSV